LINNNNPKQQKQSEVINNKPQPNFNLWNGGSLSNSWLFNKEETVNNFPKRKNLALNPNSSPIYQNDVYHSEQTNSTKNNNQVPYGEFDCDFKSIDNYQKQLEQKNPTVCFNKQQENSLFDVCYNEEEPKNMTLKKKIKDEVKDGKGKNTTWSVSESELFPGNRFSDLIEDYSMLLNNCD